jgi:hypothetical protein
MSPAFPLYPLPDELLPELTDYMHILTIHRLRCASKFLRQALEVPFRKKQKAEKDELFRTLRNLAATSAAARLSQARKHLADFGLEEDEVDDFIKKIDSDRCLRVVLQPNAFFGKIRVAMKGSSTAVVTCHNLIDIENIARTIAMCAGVDLVRVEASNTRAFELCCRKGKVMRRDLKMSNGHPLNTSIHGGAAR